MRSAHAIAAVLLAVAVTATPAAAQTLGTFAWQQQPFCNVITVTVTQTGGVYRLEGSDDQCGAARRGTALGVAVSNPNGTIGFGLTLVTNDGAGRGGAPVHIDATIDLASLGGTWRDSAGRTGAWVFNAGGPAGGSPRPAADPGAAPVFAAGLSAGNQRVTAVATPTQPGDAATKGYVDATAPRAAKASRFGSGTALGAGCDNYLSVTVTAPGAGQVVVTSSVQMQIIHVSGAISQARAGVAASPADCGWALGDAMFFGLTAAMPSTTYYPLGAVVGTFDVAGPGTYTYYLTGYRAIGTNTMVFNAASLIATWYPR